MNNKLSGLPVISIIIPCYNEGINVSSFYRLLSKIIDSDKKHFYELIYVDDGSNDNTLIELENISKLSDRVKVLSLSRNFGKEIATSAGIFYSKGDATIMIDGDGQHPAELIPELVRIWEEGYQVVIGVRESNQKEGFVKRFGSLLFYKLFNSTSGANLVPGATDFRLIDKEVSDEFKQFTERYRITRGLIDWMGYRRTYLPFNANERMGGKSSYKISKLLKLAMNSFVSLSMVPLYAIGYVGAFITLMSFFGGLFIIIEQLVLSDPIGLNLTGTAMLSIMMMFLVGIVLVSQGLVSIYLSHIHVQTQQRPLFIVNRKTSINVD